MSTVRGIASPTRLIIGFSIIGFGILASQGCTLTVDVDSLQGGVEALDCSPTEKACPVLDENGSRTGRFECKSITNVTVGCGSPECLPCPSGHATQRCDSEARCVVSICDDGWDDCDHDGKTCETDLRSDDIHCGGCDDGDPDPDNNFTCARNKMFTDCRDGRCVKNGCHPGFLDCNEDMDDGCEVEGESCP